MAGYKINEHKLMTVAYTKNSMVDKEIILTVPFKIVERNLKHLWNNLIKNVEDIAGENYKTFKENNRMYRKMEKSSMFVDWNVHTAESNLWIPYDSNQNTIDIIF